MATHPPTKTYVERRRSEGMPTIEIIRCLKRYLARQLFPIIRALTDQHEPATPPTRALEHAA